MADERLRARAYTREHGEDVPEISGWAWPYAPDGSRRDGVRAGEGADTGDDNVAGGGNGSQSAGGEDAMAASG
jgi:xylulose-5-phosphate/fructose-6-phosphate phosphoketolase